MIRLGAVSRRTHGVMIRNFVEDLVWLCPGQYIYYPWPTPGVC